MLGEDTTRPSFFSLPLSLPNSSLPVILPSLTHSLHPPPWHSAADASRFVVDVAALWSATCEARRPLSPRESCRLSQPALVVIIRIVHRSEAHRHLGLDGSDCSHPDPAESNHLRRPQARSCHHIPCHRRGMAPSSSSSPFPVVIFLA